MLLGCLLPLTGCDVGSPDYATIDTPKVHLIGIRGTSLCLDPNDKTCDPRPGQTKLASNGSTILSPTTSLTLVFDRFLDPLTATRQSVCLSSSAPVAALSDCKGQIALNPSYDPVNQSVTYYLAPGTTLDPKTAYQITAFTPPTDTLNGFRAFDGALLEANASYLFTTASSTTSALAEGPPAADFFCKGGCEPGTKECAPDPSRDCLSLCQDDKALPAQCSCTTSDPMFAACKASCCAVACSTFVMLTASCAIANCHSKSDVGPAMGLDFESPADIKRAVGTVAHETQEGGFARTPDSNPLRFGRAMPIIDAPPTGGPGNSYLMYKLLASSAAMPQALEPEIARLRASVVVGLPMPAAGINGQALTLSQLNAMSQWIAAGAPTPTCQ